MTEIIRVVTSLCPECLETVSGRLLREEDRVDLQKTCRSHGRFRTTIWRGEPSFDSWVRSKSPYSGGERRISMRGCPHDCGLCEHHSQRTCTALIEVTSRCNLNCPVCFADSHGQSTDPDREQLQRTLSNLMATTGGCNLQISGGEPTVRQDLPEIIEMARQTGFTFIQLNSNGLLLAEDSTLAPRLRDAGLSSVFLQFDSINDGAYSVLRGRDLFAVKRQAIDNSGEAGLGVVLVPTVVPGVNSDQLWQIVKFALARQPYVRGVHFQPISYFGRYPESFIPNHFTLPEIMSSLEKESDGILQVADFHPPGCEHELCSFSARYLVLEDGTIKRLGGNSGCDCQPKPAEEGAMTAISTTARQWNAPPISLDQQTVANDDLSRFLQRAKTHTFQISAMAFQDVWNLNLERLQGCCVHVALEDGRLIPFCSYNLTSRHGRSLYRKSIPVQQEPVARTTVDKLVARRLGLSHTLSRNTLDQTIMAQLRKTVHHAMANSRYYAERLAGFDPEVLRKREDLVHLPLLTGSDLVEQGHRLQCVSQSRVARVVTLQTSGSTGQPKRLMFTREDLSATLDFFLHGMHSLIDGSDRVLVMLPFEQPDSVGDLLIRALREGGVYARGEWPPTQQTQTVVQTNRITCVVGLPQHLLALAEATGPGQLRTMLLCSDYGSPALRKRIEYACGCETFLHYGATESGLGGAVECRMHDGCHIRESELLVEIIDPESGRNLPDGALGEVVITTLGRQAMPLLRYRTGDLASLQRHDCSCGGISARLSQIRGRLTGSRLGDGTLHSQDLDDELYQIHGLLDYRAIVDGGETDMLKVEYIATPSRGNISSEISRRLKNLPVIQKSLANGSLLLEDSKKIEHITPNHTVKRTILDLRSKGDSHATNSQSPR